MSTADEARAEAERRYGKPESRVSEKGRHATANEIAGFVAGAGWQACRPITDEQVANAWRAYWAHSDSWRAAPAAMRAALNAALGVQS